MPELPEAETIRRQISGRLRGRTIGEVRVRRRDILMNRDDPAAFAEEVVGRRVEGVDRRAKYPLLRLGRERVLQFQLRMTGRMVVRPEPPEEFRHVAAELDLEDGRTLYYDDQRRLGGLKLFTVEGWRREDDRLGPEPLAPSFTPDRLAAILEGSRQPVKNRLMDQRRLAGVGNIYASELLFRARIDPRRQSGRLASPEVERLHGALKQVLREAIRHCGTSLRDYVGASGEPGDFQRRIRVYGRDGRPCPSCGEPVRRLTQAGRSTFLCPACQD